MLNLFPEITVNAHCPFPCWYVYGFFSFWLSKRTSRRAKLSTKLVLKIVLGRIIWVINSNLTLNMPVLFLKWCLYLTNFEMIASVNVVSVHVGQSHHVIGRKSRDTIHRTTLPRAVQNTNYFASEWSKSVGWAVMYNFISCQNFPYLSCPKSFANLYAYRGLPTMWVPARKIRF